MMYRGETPWHGFGTRIEGKLTAVEALQLAGLDWTVELEEVRALLEDGTQLQLTDGSQAVVRHAADGSVMDAIATVGARYTLIQNQQVAEWADLLTSASEGKAWVEAAGSLDGGRRTWFLLRLGEAFKVDGDDSEVMPYALLANSHDGSLNLTIKPTPVRVVCNNTLTAAIPSGRAKTDAGEISIRHTASSEARLAEAIRALDKLGDWYSNFKTLASKLTIAKFSRGQYEELVKGIVLKGRDISNPKTGGEKAAATRAQATIDSMTALYDTTPGAMPGTAWGAYQAITDYTSHYQPTNNGNELESRAKSQMWGAAKSMNQLALDLILAATKEQLDEMPAALQVVATDTVTAPARILDEVIAATMKQ
jgi:phage/plasmid-like protein (TIGR03299 family)